MTGAALKDRALFGVTALVSSNPPVNAAFTASETMMGCRWPVAGVFYSFDTPWWTHRPELDNLTTTVPDRVLHVCWMPSRTDRTVQLADIPRGVYDGHIGQILAGMAAWPGRVVCRFGHEMNANWYTWSAAHPGPKGCTHPAQYVAAWRHIVAKARHICPDVEWFWCPAGSDVGGYPMRAYWPGRAWVDVVGFDAYNGYGSWVSPYQTLKPGYDAVCALHPTAEVWVGELGCVEDPTDPDRKAGWARQLFGETRLPRLAAVNFFNREGGRDWRFHTSPISCEAFAAGFTSAIRSDAVTARAGVLPPATVTS